MTASSDILRVGVSGLLTFQRALSTTGHNIANVNTPGFSRQRLELAARPPQFLGGQFLGSGVTVTDVRRVTDGFLDTAVQRATADHGQAQTFRELGSRLDRLLADADTGLATSLNAFFAALQGVADDPTSLPQRQVLLRDAQNLSARFNALDRELGLLNGEVDSRLEDAVHEINEFSAGIAELNRAISRGGPGEANDLVDQRTELVRQLAERVQVRTVEQDNGTLSVFSGFGEPLVVGLVTRSLAVAPSPMDPERSVVVNADGGAISDSLAGGTIGGLAAFRSQVLDPARGALGRVAVALAEAFNRQHRLGLDLNGAAGRDFFVAPTPEVIPASANSGGSVDASIATVVDLTGSDYMLRSEDGADLYTLTRLSDGNVVSIDTGGTSPFTTTVDGVTLTIGAGAAAGDSFLLRATSPGAGQIGVSLQDPAAVAAASPVSAQAELINAGSARVAAVEVTGTTHLPLAEPPTNGSIALTFDATQSRFTVVPDPFAEGPLIYDPATDAHGKDYTLLNGDLRITIAGVPVDGDQLTLADTSNGVGDNRNLLALAPLANEPILAGGALDLPGAYAELVGRVGADVRAGESAARATASVLSQSVSARESVSGVNLDEEAADLLRFQQAYQASAQVIAAAEDLFQSLLNALRS
jgi:flagellar hook-associated protein 1 FlgK